MPNDWTQVPSTTTIPLPYRATGRCLAGLLAVALVQAFWPGPAQAARELRTVAVADPYLEMHTGPGRGYPIFHVVDRGERVRIVRRRTDWFKVRAPGGKAGWVARAQMARTLEEDGTELDVGGIDIDDFTNARWEFGVSAGDFDGGKSISLYGGYSFTPQVSVEAWGSRILGTVANGWMGSVNVVHEAFPDWRVSPFFTLGAGIIHDGLKSTFVPGRDGTWPVGHVGAGFRVYAAQRFLLRVEYKSYLIVISRDNNEDVEEWKVGFAFFF